MKTYQQSNLLVIGLLMIPGAMWAEAAATPFIEMSSRYEAIRLALLEDSIEGVPKHGSAIQDLAQGLLEDFEVAKASMPEQDAASLETALETMLLRDTPTGWKIFHIHWSSRAKKEK